MSNAWSAYKKLKFNKDKLDSMDTVDIANSAQLACVLESSCPKPGNVDRYHNFRDTKYEHFLASGIAIGRYAEKAAVNGFKAGRGGNFNKILLGELIKDALLESRRWHKGKNTNLGIAMLLIPLSAASGLSLSRTGEIENSVLREDVDRVIRSSTYIDSIALYTAIRLVEPGGLGEVGYLDVRNRDSERIIEAKKMNLYDIMKLTKGDSIAMELTNKMKVSFEIGYPAIVDAYRETKDISKAILQGFMNILSMVPDSLIARKRGRRTAEKISEEARSILETGFDRERLASFDKKLRDKNNALNPGATADLTASSLMIAVLNGLRP